VSCCTETLERLYQITSPGQLRDILIDRTKRVLVLVSQHIPHAHDLSPYHGTKAGQTSCTVWEPICSLKEEHPPKLGKRSGATACFAEQQLICLTSSERTLLIMLGWRLKPTHTYVFPSKYRTVFIPAQIPEPKTKWPRSRSVSLELVKMSVKITCKNQQIEEKWQTRVTIEFTEIWMETFSKSSY